MKQRWAESEKRKSQERGVRVPEEKKQVREEKEWEVRSHLAGWDMNNCTPLWCEADWEVKMSKGRQHMSAPSHLWQLRCGKSALRCGVKHVAKSTLKKQFSLQLRISFASWTLIPKVHTIVARSRFRSQNPGVEALLELEISKKCTPLWHEAWRKSPILLSG